MAKFVALAGFMGSGKTAVGEALAIRLGWRFVDLDEAVVETTAADIAEIFATQGEEAFRAKECEVLGAALAAAVDKDGLVLSLGGGTLQSAAARSLLEQRGGVVFLDVDTEVAWKRSAGTGRPLARERQAFGELYSTRRAMYEEASDWLVPVEGRSVAELAGEIAEIVTRCGPSWGSLWGRRLAGTQRPSMIVGGPGALEYVSEASADIGSRGSRVFVITDENVDSAWGATVSALLGGSQRETLLVVEPGESSKSMGNLGRCWEWLAERGARRDDVVVALGGGVVGDLGGFAAATYQRGVGLWQIPTSLLAQVDSSVGGKTAINLMRGKNLVGTFYQPDLVVVDPRTLATLPDHEYQGGFGEIVKHALLASEASLAWLEDRAEGLIERDARTVSEVVKANIAYKSGVVEKDEREAGARAVLNLGHTTAHALEVSEGYGRMSHGQAVALGLLAALALSEVLLGLDVQVRERTGALITRFGLRTSIPIARPSTVWSATLGDKKARAATSGFVGLRDLGQPVWGLDIPQDAFTRALEVISE